jgi:hypothetical protein
LRNNSEQIWIKIPHKDSPANNLIQRERLSRVYNKPAPPDLSGSIALFL